MKTTGKKDGFLSLLVAGRCSREKRRKGALGVAVVEAVVRVSAAA
jgi:hypothetical protein